MALYLGDKGIEDLYLGADRVAEMYLGASLIYSGSGKEIFKDGVLMDGVRLTNIAKNASNELQCDIYGGMGSGPFDRSINASIRFDMTRFNKITIKGQTFCYGYDQNDFTRKIGLDTASIILPRGYRGGWGTDGAPANFTQVLNVATVTGQHSIALFVRCWNKSDYYPGCSAVRITEIIGER